MKIPATIFNWKEPASLPRCFAGAISEIYIGPTTDDAPTAIPPIKRNVINKIQIDESVQPIADIKYKTAIIFSVARRPYFCAGIPAIIDPITVPIRLDATVNPCQKESRCH